MGESIPQVEGLRLIARADPDEGVGRGEVWRARITGGLAGEHGERLPADLAGVGECLVRLLRMPVDEALRARAQTLAEDLLALRDPGLVPVRSVRSAYDGIALVYGHVPPSAMGLHVLARRRLLSAGEVVTLGVALCWALAEAHAAGITHGRLSDADVLIGADGRPMLSGMGVRGVLGAPAEPDEDVRALERMLASLLDRRSAGAARVVAALTGANSTAVELAARLAAAAAASPVVTDDAAAQAPPVAPENGEARRFPRLFPRLFPRVRLPYRPRPRTLAAGAGIVLLGALAGWASAPSPRHVAGARVPAAEAAQPSQLAQPSRAAVDWRQLLERLDLSWGAAFTQPDPARLAAVDTHSGPAYRYDLAAVTALRSRGLHASGLRIVLESVTPVRSITGQRMVLRVTDRRLPYQLLDARGRLVSRVAGRASVTHLIELDNAGAGWRLARVSS